MGYKNIADEGTPTSLRWGWLKMLSNTKGERKLNALHACPYSKEAQAAWLHDFRDSHLWIAYIG